MTVEDPVVPFWDWLFGNTEEFGALWSALIILPLIAFSVLFVAYLSFAAQYGPGAAFARVGNMIRVALQDLFNLSLRRVFAMSWLAFQEAIRMRVLVAFGVFVFVMLFASWYLDVKSDNPAKLYMAVVLGWTNLLVLMLALFLSTFSLPNDIKNRTIYTVVTKPVRLIEVILGRMLGFIAIGTLILAVLCLLSYIFVLRGLSHGHVLEADNEGIPVLSEDRSIKDEDGNFGWTGQTSEDDYHRHRVYINPDGSGFTDVQKGHRHRIYNTNGFAEPIADLLAKARRLRQAEKAKNKTAIPALAAVAYGNTQQQAARLAEQARAAAARSTDDGELYEQIADALAAANGYASDKKTKELVASLNDARSAANDLAIARFVVGPPIDQLQARVPKYGSLTFTDREGLPSDKGVNVGNEWTYRSYIEGGGLMSAIWTFDDVTSGNFPTSNPEFGRGIPLDLTLRVFRTHKGDIESGILGRMEIVEYLTPEQIRKGVHPLVSEQINFTAEEFTAARKTVPYTTYGYRNGELQLSSVEDAEGNPLPEKFNLFEDFAHNGKLIVRIQCEEPSQYFGAAKPDVYIWTGNNYFFVNFAKGYGTLWCQMVLVIAFGVTLSTFVSGPVAMLATVMSYVTGYFSQFISDVTTGEIQGGGPLESLIRIVKQKNLVTELDETSTSKVLFGMDDVMLSVMWVFSRLMPNYANLQTSAYVSSGYDIPPELMVQHFLTVLVYFVVLSTLGYMIFKSREVAA